LPSHAVSVLIVKTYLNDQGANFMKVLPFYLATVALWRWRARCRRITVRPQPHKLITLTPGKKIKIGFAMATVKEERWQRDNEAFKAHCVKMNVECVVTVATNNSRRQANDVDNLLTQELMCL
jgi:hypothetical protein